MAEQQALETNHPGGEYHRYQSVMKEMKKKRYANEAKPKREQDYTNGMEEEQRECQTETAEELQKVGQAEEVQKIGLQKECQDEEVQTIGLQKECQDEEVQTIDLQKECQEEEVQKDGQLECLEDIQKEGQLECLEDIQKEGQLECLEDIQKEGQLECLEDIQKEGQLEGLEDIQKEGQAENALKDNQHDIEEGDVREEHDRIKTLSEATKQENGDNKRRKMKSVAECTDANGLQVPEQHIHCSSQPNNVCYVDLEKLDNQQNSDVDNKLLMVPGQHVGAPSKVTLDSTEKQNCHIQATRPDVREQLQKQSYDTREQMHVNKQWEDNEEEKRARRQQEDIKEEQARKQREDTSEEKQVEKQWENSREEEKAELDKHDDDSDSSNNTTEDSDTEVDPRVAVNLEIMNQCCADINRLENELDEARSKYRSTFQVSSHRLEEVGCKIRKSIRKARVYFELMEQAKEAQSEATRAARQYQSASSNYRAAKEMITLAEQNFQNHDCKTCNLSSAWQETLNHATVRVMESEREKTRSEAAHDQKAAAFTQLETRLHYLEKKYKRSIVKARPYFETKAELELKLQQLKQNVLDLQQTMNERKARYAEALRCLETVSLEIHQSRRSRQNLLLQFPREPGVGAEVGSLSSSISDVNIERRGLYSSASYDEDDEDGSDDAGEVFISWKSDQSRSHEITLCQSKTSSSRLEVLDGASVGSAGDSEGHLGENVASLEFPSGNKLQLPGRPVNFFVGSDTGQHEEVTTHLTSYHGATRQNKENIDVNEGSMDVMLTKKLNHPAPADQRIAGDGSTDDDHSKQEMDSREAVFSIVNNHLSSASSQGTDHPSATDFCSGQLSFQFQETEPQVARADLESGKYLQLNNDFSRNTKNSQETDSHDMSVKKVPLRRTDSKPLKGLLLLNPSDLAASSLSSYQF